MVAVEEKDLQNILEGCLTNNRKAQESLFRLFYGFAMNIALRYSRDEMDAADIVSHAFVKVFKNLKTFDSSKGTIRSWIKKIVVNEGIDHFKSRSKFKNDLELESVPEPQINNAILERMGVDEIMALVKRLPPATHAVFILYAVEGYNHREISEKLNISEGTSKWHLSEARKSLQKQIQNIK
jgi:RNA polymerase sigma factor (sigma-70 family)